MAPRTGSLPTTRIPASPNAEGPCHHRAMETRSSDGRLTVRIGDADREECLDALSDHHVWGRLTLDELDRRQRAALTAVTRDDLAGLLADLPSGTSPSGSLAVSEDWVIGPDGPCPSNRQVVRNAHLPCCGRCARCVREPNQRRERFCRGFRSGRCRLHHSPLPVEVAGKAARGTHLAAIHAESDSLTRRPAPTADGATSRSLTILLSLPS
jgi:hypothetical protein